MDAAKAIDLRATNDRPVWELEYDSADLTQPYLIQFSPDTAPVHTRADRGQLSPDGKEILMQGNVRVTRGASGTDPAGEVQTREMRVILE